MRDLLGATRYIRCVACDVALTTDNYLDIWVDGRLAYRTCLKCDPQAKKDKGDNVYQVPR